MDNNTQYFLILVFIAVGIGVFAWVIHFYIPSAPDLIKSINPPSLLDMFKSIKP